MRELSVFEAVVEPSVERIPLVDIRCFDVVEGRQCEIAHVVYRNVFTEFDHSLSRHLAAVTGAGFPAISATIRIREAKSDTSWQNGKWLHFQSLPHALRGIAARSLKKREMVELFIHVPENEAAIAENPGARRQIGKGDVAALTAALEFCAALGEIEFIDLSGDYDLIVAHPAGENLKPVTIDLFRGTLVVHGVFGNGTDVLEAPLFDFRRLLIDNQILRTYAASTRHALAAAKEEAVMTFRAAAETRILNFDRALAGRPLEDYRLDAVISLVARLKAGLGDNLSGLSEDAQITALDWSALIERTAANGGGPNKYSVLDFLLRGPHRAAS